MVAIWKLNKIKNSPSVKVEVDTEKTGYTFKMMRTLYKNTYGGVTKVILSKIHNPKLWLLK